MFREFFSRLSSRVNIIIGYILLMPAVATVFMFIWDIVLRNAEYTWGGESGRLEDGGYPFLPYLYLWAHPENWTSHLVLFVGITAAVGAYLVKSKN